MLLVTRQGEYILETKRLPRNLYLLVDMIFADPALDNDMHGLWN